MAKKAQVESMLRSTPEVAGEVLPSISKWRDWSMEEKLRILAQGSAPGWSPVLTCGCTASAAASSKTSFFGPSRAGSELLQAAISDQPALTDTDGFQGTGIDEVVDASVANADQSLGLFNRHQHRRWLLSGFRLRYWRRGCHLAYCHRRWVWP